MRRWLPGVLFTSVVLALTGTGVPVSAAAGDPSVYQTSATGIRVPWGVGFLPNLAALVTERPTGKIFYVKGGTKRAVADIGRTYDYGEGGLLGLAVSPRFATDAKVFVFVTTKTGNEIMSMEYRGGKMINRKTILSGMPMGRNHNGGRLRFGPDGYLYATPGDTGRGELAQNPRSLAGKILRITTTGAPAPGNPDPASPIYSSGHRDVQGIAWDSSGQLWASEFGQDRLDELNRIVPGGNYGWPACEGPCATPTAGFIDPELTWATDKASPSGLEWAGGHLWMAALRGQRLWRIDVVDGHAQAPRAYFVGKWGRLRTVERAPTGRMWLTTSNRDGRGTPARTDDRIFSLNIG